MENKFIINDCTLIPSEGSSLKQEFNIGGGNPSITYFESIKSPAISLSLNIIDVDQLISRYGITGGEYLSLRVKVQGYDKEFEIKPKKHLMMLNSVKDVSTSSSKQVATFRIFICRSYHQWNIKSESEIYGNVTDNSKKIIKR